MREEITIDITCPYYKAKLQVQNQLLEIQIIQHPDISYEVFQKIQLRFAELAVMHECQLILMDSSRFTIDVPYEFTTWLAENVDPMFKSVPVKKIASVVSKEVYHFFKQAELDYGGMVRRAFINRNEAMAWLTLSEGNTWLMHEN